MYQPAYAGHVGSASSSFPVSSPSFWNEAAIVTTPPSKRSRSPTPLIRINDNEEESSSSKRPRKDSPGTALSYLPNRLDRFDEDDPHSYLANPEYAPNRFGDIGDYMRKKEVKVQAQNRDIAIASAAEGLPQIFKDLSFYINGNTHPPMEELRKMILQRGGEVRPKLQNKGWVKFIIAPMLTQMKFKQFERYRVVREGWITESCKQGKLLNWSRWKLQVQGGWEESGRRGLEGFLGGKTTQVSQGSSMVKAEDSDGDEQMETNDMSRLDDQTNAAGSTTPLRSRPSTPQIIPSVETQSLPQSAISRPIPISPGANRAETSQKEKIPANVSRPEGWWEHYYSKDSNEDAGRLLRNQEWRSKNTAERGNEGGFIDGYYQNSRLHHLSTWKAELKVLVAAAQMQSEEQAVSHPSKSSLSPYTLSTSALPRAAQATATPGERVVFHVDFDCFFVSCGIVTRPHLKGKPVVVCHSQAGRGTSSTSEIASASYEARAKGVRNGMSLGRARALTGDQLQTIPYEFDTYKKFSLAFYTVLMGYADELQAVSVDEALIDVTSAVAARALAPEEAANPEVPPVESIIGEPHKHRDPAMEVAERIRSDVRGLTEGCEVSIGIAHNILLAKLATRRAKPAGAFHLMPEAIPDFIAPLDVEHFPSIGYSIRGKIQEQFGTTTCDQLLEQSKGAFKALLGPKTGEMVWGYLRGMDDRKLDPHKERKSISAEMNYGIRFQNQEQAEICVADLAAEVAKRMKQVNARGRLLTLKLMSRHPDAPIEPPKFLGHGRCETLNKSAQIANGGGSATDDPDILAVESVKLLRAMRLDPKELRGVGIQITKLDGEKTVEREAGQAVLHFGVKWKRSGSIEQSTTTEMGAPVDDQEENFQTIIDTADGEKTSPPRSIRSGSASPHADQHEGSPSPATRDTDAQATVTASPPSAPLTRRRSLMQAAEAGPSRVPTSSDGIDPDFLAALPADLRQEVKRDFARTRGATKSETLAEVRDVDEDGVEEQVSPSKIKGQHAAAHITRQLRPKLKTQLKAREVSELPLYGAWARAKDSEKPVELTVDDEDETLGTYRVSELQQLGIDPAVFRELPEDMRGEVIEEERRHHRQRRKVSSIATRRGQNGISRLRDEGPEQTAPLSPSKSSRAGSVPPHLARPLVAVSRPLKPSLLKATALPDVLDTVTRWIDSRAGAAPATKDANKVSTYLVKRMDPGMGMGGIEDVTEVLRWMKMEITMRWDKEGQGDSLAGIEWWKTWHAFKDTVDEVALKRLGATLRLS